ncbi:unnamed protein product [Leuciscus chuanchicus]
MSVAGRPAEFLSCSVPHCLMESVGALDSPIGASFNLLSLPATFPWDEDEESLGLEGIKPKTSPIPRRRSSVSSDDSLPPPSSSRRVSFADAFGLSLVSVKQFDSRGVTAPSGPLESDLNEDKEYYILPLFTLPQTAEELDLRVHEQKLELESLELLSGTSTLRGIVRVLDVCFDKMVYVRTSLDSWRSHFDLLAEYVPGSNKSGTDCFSFKITLVPPFGEEGVRVDFCLRYDTSLGTFWANNNEKNYSLFCCEKIKEKPQNVSENGRKSCLKTTSPNVSASTVEATDNEEFPDINLNDSSPGSLKENSEKLEKENMDLEEEISKIRSRRSKRRAVRLAKVKEHFAKKEEEKQGTKTKESEVTAETSMQEHASVLEKTSCSPQSTQTAPPPTCNQISPSEYNIEYSGYSTDIYSQALTQHEEAMINTKTNLSTAHTHLPLEDCGESIACSASEALEDSQLTEDLTDQKVSIKQSFSVCQNPDLSICKSVERAWKHFEKDTKQRIKSLALSSKMDEDTNISDGKPEENVSLKTTNYFQPQPFSHGFTFGTIVAPLYHQVFKSMETERKDLFRKALRVDKSLRELGDESLTAVTAAETTDIWPKSCISAKQTVHDISVGVCKESTEQNSQLTINPTKNPISEPNKYTPDNAFTETNLPKVTSEQPDPPLGTILPLSSTEFSFQGDLGQSPCLFPLQGPELLVSTNQTIESGIDNLPKQIHPSSPTSVLKTSLSVDNQISSIKIETSQNQGNKEENILERTRYSNSPSCILAQSPEDPTKLPTSEIILGSDDDKSEPDCCEMRLNIEKLEELSHLATAMLTEPYAELGNTQINMSNTLESCQINEKKEQMLIGFALQTSETESSSMIEFDGEHNTLVIKEEIHKMKNYESLEEGNGNQTKQIEKQEQDKKEKDQEPKEQEGAGEGGMNIEDELKYIDDEEDLDAMETERENKPQADADDLLSVERDSEEQKQIISTSNVKSFPQHHIDLKEIENLGGVEDSEKQDRHFNSGVEICEETAASWQESSQKSDTELSGSTQAMENDWDLIEFIDKEESMCCGSENSDRDTTDDVNNMLENMDCQAKDSMNRDLENVDDNTSTESQTDDEMELYMISLRNSQQSVFREGTMSGSYGKRPSMSKGRPLAMPSISESVDEDQSNSSLEDLTNTKYIMELERATLPLVIRNEHVIPRNVLWWKEFLSYDNMSRVIGYTFLLIVFLVAAFYYDFIACFALYFLTVYWLFRQGEEEPLKNSRKSERGLQ